jgi:hypothetical protein
MTGMNLYMVKVYDDKDRAYCETIVGASVFYLPSDKKTLWSGYISEEALKTGERVIEHMYPRRIGGKELLSIDWDCVSDPEDHLRNLYYSKYGRYHFVTKKENTSLRPYQKYGIFTTPEDAYYKCNIKLIQTKIL